MMRRHVAIAGLAVALAAPDRPAAQPGPPFRVGILSFGRGPMEGFRRSALSELAREGFVEGRDLELVARSSEGDAPLLHEGEQPLPDTQARPADEHLSGTPPRTKVGGDGAPLGPVLVPPQDGAHRPAEILRRLTLRAARLHQRLQHRPLLVAQHHLSSIRRGETRTETGGSTDDKP